MGNSARFSPAALTRPIHFETAVRSRPEGWYSAGMDQLRQIIFFDGQCVVCDRGMTWILARDVHRRFLFAPLQGETAHALLTPHFDETELPDSLILLEEDGARSRVLLRSAALIAIVRQLPGWLPKCLALGSWLPTSLRDLLYDAFAARRTAWFGRMDACRMPTPAEAACFLP